MISRYFPIACLVACSVAATAAPQDGYNRETYARKYVQFLVLELDQWTKAFPHDYNMALMRPPVDASKLSEGAKAGASDLRDSITRLFSLRGAQDLLTNAGFREQLDKTLSVAKQVNPAMGGQRFPDALQSDWDQIRTNLNSLAGAYNLEALPVLEPPGGRGGGGRRGPAPGASPGDLTGYIVDQSCAAKGKGMWANTSCVERCVRDGDKVVLVTEEGKVYQISNQDKITAESYGQKVTVTGKRDGEAITVDGLRM